MGCGYFGGKALKNRPEVDGLRALAVVPVVFYHAGIETFSGGFAGVDVFFVISGFLISYIIIEEKRNNTFELISFYQRRARRILPALLFVSGSCIPFAWFLMADSALDKFGAGLIGLSVMASNIMFWTQAGYFEETSDLNPILHTWSLSIEGQFYIFFPILMILLWRFNSKKIFFALFLIAFASLCLAEWGWRNKPVANFYLMPTRIWELIAGSLVAIVIHMRKVKPNDLYAGIGLFLIFSAYYFYDGTTPFPSTFTLAPVVGTALVLLFASEHSYIGKLLKVRPLVFIGLLSYSIYLWHQPIFAFYRLYTKEIELDWLTIFIVLVVTVSFSFLTWRFLETPFRVKGLKSRHSVPFLWLGFSFLLILTGTLSRKGASSSEYQMALDLHANEFVYFENMDERKFIEGRLFYPLEKAEALVVGSSRLMELGPEILGEEMLGLTVSGASVEDDIAIGLEAFSKIGYEKIYIAADPWLLNLHSGQDRYKTIEAMYFHWIENLHAGGGVDSFLNPGINADPIHPVAGFLSTVRRGFVSDAKYRIPSHGRIEGVAKKSKNGIHIYNKRFAERGSVDIQRILKQLHYGMDNFVYDDHAIKELELFVNYLKAKGVEVTFVLVPYHPVLYNEMKSNYAVFLEVEKWFREFASSNRANIVGSYDPNIFECEGYEFYDGMHAKVSCLHKVFSVE